MADFASSSLLSSPSPSTLVNFFLVFSSSPDASSTSSFLAGLVVFNRKWLLPSVSTAKNK
jgi:hypothetical protein